MGERGPVPDLRRQFNTMMWRFRAGCPWRDVPKEYGSGRPSTAGGSPIGPCRGWPTTADSTHRYEQPSNYLAPRGLAAALCCHKCLRQLTMQHTVLAAHPPPEHHHHPPPNTRSRGPTRTYGARGHTYVCENCPVTGWERVGRRALHPHP
ncbi:transposase [Streptomyces sp. NBC_01237]|uniref:transposase n=1 Tax=Streptomyces sp. NBC_01237 TaxID=2903790 RepID=UPI003FA3CB25